MFFFADMQKHRQGIYPPLRALNFHKAQSHSDVAGISYLRQLGLLRQCAAHRVSLSKASGCPEAMGTRRNNIAL